jgi:hypothetical protein
VKLRQKRQFPEALATFQKAHAVAPSGRTLAQIGLTEANLKRWVDAETHLAAALEAHDTPWIEAPKNRDAIVQALDLVSSHIGLVQVVGPNGAEIAIGGVPVGRLPLPSPIHVSEGRARIEGSADGRRSSSVALNVPGGKELTVHLDLPLQTVSTVPPPAAPPAPAAPQTSLAEKGFPADTETSWKTWTGGGLLGVSAALIATGVVWMAVDGNGTCSPPAGDRCMREYDTRTQGMVAIGAGVAAAVGGGLLLWQGRHSDGRLALGLGSVAASGTF